MQFRPASLAFFIITYLLTTVARGDFILDSIGEMKWTRSPNSTDSLPILFGVTASNDGTDNLINSFNVGIRILPTADATGTLRIKLAALPEKNAIFSNYAFTPSLVSVLDFQVINGENFAFSNVSVSPSTSRSLFSAHFFSPGDSAIGKFDIYADRDTSNYFTTTAFDGFKFQNVPSTGDGNGVYLGSISVSVVPEPSAVLLTVVLFGASLCYRHCRREPPLHLHNIQLG